MATILNSSLDWILPSWIQPFCTKLWLKLVQSDSNSFILTQLDDGSHLEFCYLGFSHFAQKKTSLKPIHSTQLDDGSHLEFCHFDSDNLGFRHLVIFSDSLKNTLTPLWLWLKLIPSDLTWWWQPSWILPYWILPSWIQPFCTEKTLTLVQSDSFWLNLMMAAILNSANMNSAILDSAILLNSHSKTFISHSEKKLQSCILTQTWWWQPSWILPSWIQPFCTKKNFTHSFWLNLNDGSHLEFCHIGFRHCHLGFRHLGIFSQIHSKNTLTPFWLWLKLIQSATQTHSFSLNLMMAVILNSAILDSAILHKKVHLFILTQLDDHLEICHLGFSHLHKKKLHSCILTQLNDGNHLELCHVGFRHCHLGFRHLVIFSQIHSKTFSLHSDSVSN